MRVSVGLVEGLPSVEVELTGGFTDAAGGRLEPGRHRLDSEALLTPPDLASCAFVRDGVTIGRTYTPPAMRRAWAIGLGAVLLIAGSGCRRALAPTALTLSVPYEIDTLDPHAKDQLGNASISQHFYEALVSLDAEMGLTPALAERWDTPDLFTWVFHLRPGVRFHDGHAVTSADVVYTFERLLQRTDLECGVYLAQVAGVKALDERTVQVKTRRPYGVLLNKLSAVFVVRQGADAGLASSVNGTGPYRLVSLARDRIQMTRNETYWNRRPDVANVTFLLGRSALDALDDLTSGRCGFAYCPLKEADRVLAARPDLRLLRRAEVFVKYLAFDVAREVTPGVSAPRNPFRSRAVREAISLGIDRRALVSRLSSPAILARQIVPQAIFGYAPDLPEPPFDPAKALRLLAEAGFPRGFAATLVARSRHAEGAQRTAELLSPLGLRITVDEVSDAEFFARANRRELSFFFASFGCDTGDISDVLDAGFHTVDATRRFGTQNFGGFSSPSLDEAIEKSAGILETSERRAALWELSARVAQEHAWVPLYVEETVLGLDRRFSYRPRADSHIVAAEVTLLDK